MMGAFAENLEFSGVSAEGLGGTELKADSEKAGQPLRAGCEKAEKNTEKKARETQYLRGLRPKNSISRASKNQALGRGGDGSGRVINNASGRAAETQAVINNGIPPDVGEKLALLRAEFAMSQPVQDYKARWWARLPVNDRRLVLALCGGDDSPESAARGWLAMPESVRQAVEGECRRFARLLEPMRWA